MAQEQEPRQQLPIERWAALSSEEEAEGEYVKILERYGRLSLERTSTNPLRPMSMDEINRGARATQKYLDERNVFLKYIPKPFREHLEQVDEAGVSRMQRIQEKAIERRKAEAEAKRQEEREKRLSDKLSLSKGQRRHIRRIKAQKHGANTKDIH